MSGEELAYSIARHLRDIVSIVNADGTIRYVNHATEATLGSSPDDGTGRDATGWVHPDDLPGVTERHRWLFAEPGRTSTNVSRIRRADGGWTRMSTHGINLLHDPAIQGVLFVSRDVEQQCRDQAALEQSLTAQRLVADLGLRALVSSDLEGLLAMAIAEVAALLGATWVMLHQIDDGGMVLRGMTGPGAMTVGQRWPRSRRSLVLRALERGGPTRLRELREDPSFTQHPDSLALGVVDALCVLLEGPGGAGGALTIISDTPREFSSSEEQQLQAVANVLAGALLRQAREQEAVHQALHDDLTGLATRPLLTDRLHQALRRSDRESEPVAVLMVDLDGFKQVNDQFGHAAGDAVLRQLGPRLAGSVRPYDTVARYGGDEFVVLCDETARQDSVAQVVARIRQACAEAFVLPDGRQVQLSASIGVGWSTEVDHEPQALLAAADEAMYRDKRSRDQPSGPGLDDQPDRVAPLAGELLDPGGDLLQGQ